MDVSLVSVQERLAAYANRAACHLCCSDFGLAVDDADRGLALILQRALPQLESSYDANPKHICEFVDQLVNGSKVGEDVTGGVTQGMEPDSLCLGEDAEQEAARRASLARLLARRGTALGHLKKYLDAANDYKGAVSPCSLI